MSRKTFFWTCILLLCGLLVYAAPLAAQSDVRQIPVDMQSFGGRLSPDGRTLAIFAHSIILDDVIDESQLPIRLIDIQSGEELRASPALPTMPVIWPSHQMVHASSPIIRMDRFSSGTQPMASS
ncbi:MAG: hypothetical protein JNJ78_10890 [Anaerolineae bacterium]|nr:hypothetical protein [Anaerolineae bacterium]